MLNLKHPAIRAGRWIATWAWVLFAILVGPNALALPIVEISEDVGGGLGEYTVDIQSPIGETWYILMFAAENEQSVSAGGGGAFVDNNIGTWGRAPTSSQSMAIRHPVYFWHTGWRRNPNHYAKPG